MTSPRPVQMSQPVCGNATMPGPQNYRLRILHGIPPTIAEAAACPRGGAGPQMPRRKTGRDRRIIENESEEE